jgi:hypothetical protein
LVSSEQCRWGAGNNVPTQAGAQIPPGRLELLDGVSELVFRHGARVTLTGPVTLDLLSPDRAAVRHGRLSAYVPDAARGFTVETLGGNVIDQGTEFALVVSEAGEADLGVVAGEVEIAAGAARGAVQVRAGEIARFDRQGADPTANLARGLGAEAFAADAISLYPDRHQIQHVNDGLYGNSHSWIGGPQSHFIGIRLPGACRIEAVAFGRDNTGEFRDRCLGHYELQYTTVAAPSVETPAEHWTTIRGWDYAGRWPDGSPWLRHRYDFAPVTATGVRLLVARSGIYDGNAIDELEIYGRPLDDPSE